MTSRMRIETVALILISVTSFVSAFTSSAINIAIPSIADEFGASTLALGWVVSGYILASAACLLPFGRLADISGRRRVYLTGVVSFAAASLLCAVAWSIEVFVLFRVLKGVASAMIFSTGTAIVTSVHSVQSRGKALGLVTAATYVGLSVGPALGGLLCDLLGWRSLFYFDVLLISSAALFAHTRFTGEWKGAEGEKFDLGGALVYVTGLTCVLFSLSTIKTLLVSRYLLVLGALMLAAFVRLEANQRYPLIRVEMFKGNVAFCLSCLAAMINYSATSALGFVMSLHLQTVLGFRSQVAGIIMLSQPIVMATFSPFAGALSDRIEPRVVASFGMALTALGLIGLALVLGFAPLGLLVANLALIGLGFALFSSPNSNAIMSTVDRRFYGIASSLIATMRVIGQAVSMAIVTLLMTIYVGDVALSSADRSRLVLSSRVSFTVFSVLCVLGIGASLARGKINEQKRVIEASINN